MNREEYLQYQKKKLEVDCDQAEATVCFHCLVVFAFCNSIIKKVNLEKVCFHGHSHSRSILIKT